MTNNELKKTIFYEKFKYYYPVCTDEDWNNISKRTDLSSQFIYLFKDKLNWVELLKRYNYNSNDLMIYDKYIDWEYISQFEKLSESFIDKYSNYLNLNKIICHQKLSEEFILENFKINSLIIKHQKLSEEFIIHHIPKSLYIYIIQNQRVSEKFMIEFKNYIDWRYVARHQRLSEDFIDIYLDLLNIEDMCEFQKISLYFIEEFKDILSYKHLMKNKRYTDEFKNKIKEIYTNDIINEKGDIMDKDFCDNNCENCDECNKEILICPDCCKPINKCTCLDSDLYSCKNCDQECVKEIKNENNIKDSIGNEIIEKMNLNDGRYGLADNNVSTKLLDKSYSPMIIRKYTRIGFPLYVHMICDENLNDLDNIVHDCIDFCKEKNILTNDIQSLRNFTGILSDWINNYYDKIKRGCVESLGIIFYADKMLISSLQGDCMNHATCRNELYYGLQLMTQI